MPETVTGRAWAWPDSNFIAREINCKIVYYGPGLSGKTTNLRWIFQHSIAKTGEKMISLTTESDRTLFFDFLPVSSVHCAVSRYAFIFLLFPARFSTSRVDGCFSVARTVWSW